MTILVWCRREGRIVQFSLRVLAVICVILAGLGGAMAQTEKRVALVMGNYAYQHARTLPNPRNDTEAVARLLTANGFDEVHLRADLDYRGMRETIRLFGETAHGAD